MGQCGASLPLAPDRESLRLQRANACRAMAPKSHKVKKIIAPDSSDEEADRLEAERVSKAQKLLPTKGRHQHCVAAREGTCSKRGGVVGVSG